MREEEEIEEDVRRHLGQKPSSQPPQAGLPLLKNKHYKPIESDLPHSPREVPAGLRRNQQIEHSIAMMIISILY